MIISNIIKIYDMKNYLERTMENNDLSEQERARLYSGSGLYKKMGNFDKGEGVEEFGNDDYKLKYSVIKTPFTEGMNRLPRFSYSSTKPIEDEYCELQDYEFTNKAGGSLKLADIVPKDWKIVFNYKRDVCDGASADRSSKLILINGDISVVDGLLAMLHEVGHAQMLDAMADKELETYDKEREKFHRAVFKNEKLEKEILDKVILDERNAWARALKMLKPFIRTGIIRKEEVANHIHKVALKSYSEAISKLISDEIIIDD